MLRLFGCPKCGRTKKRTHEEFESLLAEKNTGIDVVGKYKNSKTKVLVKCQAAGHEWMGKPESILLRDYGCPRCSGVGLKTHDEFVLELSNKNPNIELIGEYVKSHKHITVRCKIDGHEWNTTPKNLLKGHGCPKCAGVIKRPQEQFVKDVIALGSKVIPIGEYLGRAYKVLAECLVCGQQWNVAAGTLLSGGGCPKCAKYGYNPSSEAQFYIYEFQNYLGFGITNVPKVRHKQHNATFKKLNVQANLIQTFSGDGLYIQELERHLKQTLPIVNSGIPGFRTEAILYSDRELLYKAIDDFQPLKKPLDNPLPPA